MKTNLSFISSTGSILSSSHPILIPALVACLLCSASHGREPVRVDLGKIALVSSCEPVALSFDKSDGRRFDSEEAGLEGARVTRELAASLPDRFVRSVSGEDRKPSAQELGEFFVEAPFALAAAETGLVAGVLLGELAPVGALAQRNRPDAVSPEELAELENHLSAAMRAIALPDRLRNEVLAVAREKTGRRIALAEVEGASSNPKLRYEPLAHRGFNSVLEISLPEVFLQRAASNDLFVLRVKARARLVRPQDGAALCEDQNFQYASGSSIFIDWTINHAEPFRLVFDSACRNLADQIVETLFREPIVAQKAALAGTPGKRVMARPRAQHPATSSPPRPDSSITYLERPVLTPQLLGDLGRVGIISTSTIPKLSIQRPLTKEQAAQEAQDDALELVSVITLHEPSTVLGPLAEGTARAALAAVALPLSIGRSVGGQVIAGARGVSEQKLAWADSAVIRLVQESSLQESIRAEVLRQAEQRTSHKIALVKKPFPVGEEQEFSRMSCVMAGTLAWVPEGQSRQYYLRSQGIDTALEIQLLYPALNSEGTKPNDITNPPMALSMEVRTSLIRVQDNEPLYSFAMKYQGPGRKFAAWAANDAASLREELQHCYQAVAAAIIDQLGVQAWPLEAQPALAGE